MRSQVVHIKTQEHEMDVDYVLFMPEGEKIENKWEILKISWKYIMNIQEYCVRLVCCRLKNENS
jgi:hypothetical protein